MGPAEEMKITIKYNKVTVETQFEVQQLDVHSPQGSLEGGVDLMFGEGALRHSCLLKKATTVQSILIKVISLQLDC